ncbi:YciI family protein [Micromonospora globispora]|uniref:YciI family protein n=2 Tax=Micromonospora globispora TaxID=1450148 RepID=UPI000F5E9F4F|nr:YciI family protein [Micromonospora globispora]RQW88717.1 hypothetical protein DKL51_24405 [Micromonospora globispora]
MRYTMVIWGDDSTGKDPALIDEVDAWWQKWHAAGKVVRGGAKLDSPHVARTVSRGADGQPVVTDGPYLELKEIIGGYIHLEADDFDETVAVAATWPAIAAGYTVEVRPIVG